MSSNFAITRLQKFTSSSPSSFTSCHVIGWVGPLSFPFFFEDDASETRDFLEAGQSSTTAVFSFRESVAPAAEGRGSLSASDLRLEAIGWVEWDDGLQPKKWGIANLEVLCQSVLCRPIYISRESRNWLAGCCTLGRPNTPSLSWFSY